VQAGARLFAEKGYGNVSVEAIAAEARASKVTFYNYFTSKEALFEAVVLEARYPALQRIGALACDGPNLRQILVDTGFAYLQMKLSPEVIATDRMVIAEAVRLPELARIYHASGPSHTVAVMQTLVDHLLARGMLLSGAPTCTIALHFMALCEAGIYVRQVWGLDPFPADATLATSVEAAVSAFIGAYAAPAYRPRQTVA
jgi:TetR/AcrR family transcriptional repressor of mexJK operon